MLQSAAEKKGVYAVVQHLVTKLNISARDYCSCVEIFRSHLNNMTEEELFLFSAI